MVGLDTWLSKLAAALSADVTVFTTTPEKTADAKRFGAKEVVLNQNGSDFSKLDHRFDFGLDTVP